MVNLVVDHRQFGHLLCHPGHPRLFADCLSHLSLSSLDEQNVKRHETKIIGSVEGRD